PLIRVRAPGHAIDVARGLKSSLLPDRDEFFGELREVGAEGLAAVERASVDGADRDRVRGQERQRVIERRLRARRLRAGLSAAAAATPNTREQRDREEPYENAFHRARDDT